MTITKVSMRYSIHDAFPQYSTYSSRDLVDSVLMKLDGASTMNCESLSKVRAKSANLLPQCGVAKNANPRVHFAIELVCSLFRVKALQ